MSDKQDGGPAFPVVESHPTCGTRVDPGMTLRDWFAGMAMQGMLANDVCMKQLMGLGDLTHTAMERLTVQSYRYADAMLAARSKP